MLRRVVVLSLLAVLALAVVPAGAAATSGRGSDPLSRVNHIVVIYQENHSFDNLYGMWERVNGLGDAPRRRTLQVDQTGAPYDCLLQVDVNLTSPPLSARCAGATPAGTSFSSHFGNRPFTIDDDIAPTDTTCPPPGVFAANGIPKGQGLPGGCTRDLVHRFYQEQYQLNDGHQNRYVTGSDAVGLTMGVYDTRTLPIYQYLHQPGHPRYAIADNFFQAAFGGSFLNHQWLIAASNPVWPNAVNDGGADDLHSVVDANAMPTSYPLYASPATTGLKDTQLTASCNPPAGALPTPPGVLCGDYAVNTTQPPYQPFAPGTAPSRRLPPQTAPTIGDRLSGAGVDWAWYSGGWSNANGDVDAPGWTNGTGPTCSDPNTIVNPNVTFPNCPDKLFQFHHQAFNYYASYAPGTPARAAHLRDEDEFLALANASDKACNLKPVSFIKPVGAENEHPGYASAHAGSSHLMDLVQAVENSRCANDTMVVVTYDEFGGQWDHRTPPGQGATGGPHDVFGPSTRIPALVISPFLRGSFVVDHTQYDTTSVAATIERRYDLAPLSTRDAAVHDLSHVFRAK